MKKKSKKSEEYLSSAEDKYILFLVKEYKKTVAIGKGFRTFTSFIEWADFEELILTERILREVFIEVGITKNFKSFLNNFRKSRSGALKFKTDAEFLKNYKKGRKPRIVVSWK